MLIDILCLNIAFVLAYIFRFHDGISPYRQSIYLAMILLMCAVQLISSMMMNTFENILKRDIYTEIKQKSQKIKIYSYGLQYYAKMHENIGTD